MRVYASFAHELETPSDDPLAPWQYTLLPRAQIAGHPAPGSTPAASEAWQYGPVDPSLPIAVLADGVESSHPDLRFWEDPEAEITLPDAHPLAGSDWHGTACAGVLGAVADNGIGIAGIAPGAPLLPLLRGADDAALVQAIDEAVALGAGVLVLPWGWCSAPSRTVSDALRDAAEAGVVLVAAAGDAGAHRPYSDEVQFPCSLSESLPLICVGAADPTGARKGVASADGEFWWSSAESGHLPDLLAPGTHLLTTDRMSAAGRGSTTRRVPPGWTDGFTGTGAAACQVAGVAALMLARDPALTPEELASLLTKSARLDDPDAERAALTRQLDAGAAVLAAVESAEERERRGAAEEPTP